MGKFRRTGREGYVGVLQSRLRWSVVDMAGFSGTVIGITVTLKIKEKNL